jgi:hypothetical protein
VTYGLGLLGRQGRLTKQCIAKYCSKEKKEKCFDMTNAREGDDSRARRSSYRTTELRKTANYLEFTHCDSVVEDGSHDNRLQHLCQSRFECWCQIGFVEPSR